MPNSVDSKIAELQALGAPALRTLWGETFGRPVPSRLRRDLLLRALAYHVQDQAEGGLSKVVRRRLARLADAKGGDNRARPPSPRPRPGTRLIREWRGEPHHVAVLDDGYEYRGTQYSSLSRIAREITGSRWSGPLFFGLRKAGAGVASDDR